MKYVLIVALIATVLALPLTAEAYNCSTYWNGFAWITNCF